MDPEQKGFERVWIHDGETLRSGPTIFTIKEFDSRIKTMHINCIHRLKDKPEHKRDLCYSLNRKDANMEVFMDYNTIVQKDIFELKIAALAVIIGASE